MPLCVLGLGSNKPFMGMAPSVLLNSAAAELSGFLSGVRVSPFYESSPLHITEQPVFINAAAAGFFPDTGKAGARRLLEAVHGLEARYGRERSSERRWGERSLDIDILLFGDAVVNEPDLCIPHPRLQERAFALRPLLDLFPDAAEPGTGTAYREILDKLKEQEIRRL